MQDNLESLKLFKDAGEKKQKSSRDAAWNVMEYGNYLMSYHVENFTKTLAVSRLDRDTVKFDDFRTEHPEVLELLGEPTSGQYVVYAKRGPTWVIQFNSFFDNPFFIDEHGAKPAPRDNTAESEGGL